MGCANITDGNVRDVCLNPAVLSAAPLHLLYASAEPSRFGLSELGTYFIGYERNINFCRAALSFTVFGYDLYHEQTIKLGLSKKIFNNLNGGISLNYNSITIKNYGSSGNISVDAGLVFELTKDINSAFSVTNLTNSGIGSDRFEQLFNAAVSYRVAKEFLVCLRIEKEKGFDAALFAGFEYEIINSLFIRSGISGNPEMYYCGFGYKHTTISFDYAFSFHNILGSTHSFAIGINFDE